MRMSHVPQPRLVLAVVAITLLSGHVAPSVDDNNRYLKLTPLGDRVRLAYTIFFGEVPGAGERRGIDANRDGTIDDAEAHAFGAKIGDQVLAALEADVDGHTGPIRWDTIDVGLGTPTVTAGSFSVDLVAYLCLPRARGHHRVIVRDRFRVPRPGETEARVEDSRGVTILHARVGPAEDPSYDYRFVGPGGPLSDDGLDLEFEAGDKAPVTADGECQASSQAGGGRWWIVALIAGAVAVAGVALALVRRSRRVLAK